MFASAPDHRYLLTALLLLALLFLSGCTTVQNNHDPIEGLNRATSDFNEIMDRAGMKPIAKAYVAVTGKKDRKAVSNFYDNILYPDTILNDFLQGKGHQGLEDLLRFIINSSIGLVGLIDVASHVGLERHNEDFGQTLAVWGVPQGAYIVYPFVGSNSVRNTPSFIIEVVTSGMFWAAYFIAPQVIIPLSVLNYIDKRARLLDASNMRDELALDPYIFTREAWRQRREYLIHDGNPPARQSDEDDWEEDGDEWEDELPVDDWSGEPPAEGASTGDAP